MLINQLAIYFPVILKITWLNITLEKIGDVSLVLSLIAVGASLSFSSAKKHLSGILTCSFLKLIALPFCVFLTLNYFNFAKELIIICTIYAGSPCSSNATPMTQKMGGDYKSMSAIISIQTVLSLATLSFLLIILENFSF